MSEQYWKDLKSVIEDDCWNFTGDGTSVEDWAETFMDCPSNSVERLFKRRNETGLSDDDYWEKVDEIVQNIVNSAEEE